MNNVFKLLDRLEAEHCLTLDEYEALINGLSKETADYAAKKAVKARQAVYGNDVYIRGLIEISNICKNDCYYCGIRNSNKKCERYRLTKDDILESAAEGYSLGFRTFVLQGGEDAKFTDAFLVDVIKNLKALYPECAITLSLGERSKESYKALKDAGADRYLLRHECTLNYAPLQNSRRNRLFYLYRLSHEESYIFLRNNEILFVNLY